MHLQLRHMLRHAVHKVHAPRILEGHRGFDAKGQEAFNDQLVAFELGLTLVI